MKNGNYGPELGSWKEIAGYLGVNVRTAQRWEQERGLPVRRVGGERGRVIAATADIDKWKAALIPHPAWWNDLHVLLAVVGCLAGILGGAGAALVLRSAPGSGQVSLFTWQDGLLVASDAQGRVGWRYPVPLAPNRTIYQDLSQGDWTLTRDVDGDGEPETLVMFYPADRLTTGDFVYCFGARGKARWRFTPGRPVQAAGETLMPPFHLRALRTLRSPENPRACWIAVSSVHHRAAPCQIAVLDETGTLRGEYLHNGHMEALAARDMNADGIEEILASGVSHNRNQAVLAILDPRRLSSPQNPGAADPVRLDGRVAPPDEIAEVFFPRSSLNRKYERWNMAYQMDFAEGKLNVYVREWRVRRPYPFLIYVLTPDLRLDRAVPSETLQNAYIELAATGRMEGPFSGEELDRLRSEVEVVRR